MKLWRRSITNRVQQRGYCYRDWVAEQKHAEKWKMERKETITLIVLFGKKSNVVILQHIEILIRGGKLSNKKCLAITELNKIVSCSHIHRLIHIPVGRRENLEIHSRWIWWTKSSDKGLNQARRRCVVQAETRINLVRWNIPKTIINGIGLTNMRTQKNVVQNEIVTSVVGLLRSLCDVHRIIKSTGPT